MKRTIPIVSAAVLVLALSGCGDRTKADADAAANQAEQTLDSAGAMASNVALDAQQALSPTPAGQEFIDRMAKSDAYEIAAAKLAVSLPPLPCFRQEYAGAIAIVDELGVDGLVMRELAHRTHYSVSTVSYHVTPWSTFLTEVWSAARVAFVDQVVPPPPVDEAWFGTMAERTVAWGEAHPQLARFLVSHFPQPEVALQRPPATDGGVREEPICAVEPADVIERHVDLLEARRAGVGRAVGDVLVGAHLQQGLELDRVLDGAELADVGDAVGGVLAAHGVQRAGRQQPVVVVLREKGQRLHGQRAAPASLSDGKRRPEPVADRAQHVRDLGIVRADVAFEEGVVVLELAQGFAGHGRSGQGLGPRTRHGSRPSVLLPESFGVTPMPLRRRPVPVSPESLARYGSGS